MKRMYFFVLIVLFLTLNCYAMGEKESFLNSFFSDQLYETKQYKIDGIDMFFSYTYSEGADDIISRGIFYSYSDSDFILYLKIENETISNADNILFQGIIETQKFYGYKINVIEKNNCISTVFCTDLGKHVTEGPILLWNSKTKSFYRYEVDRSQW